MRKSARAQGGDDPGPSTPGRADTRGTGEPEAGAAVLDVFCTLVRDCPSSIDLLWLEQQLARAMTHLGRPAGRVSVLVVDDERMADLHARFAGVRETTDVLTFPGEPLDAGPEGSIDADIAICLDEARRQAAERGHSLERELLLYALHGLLHCCGFDDHDDRSWSELHAEEDRILEAIGVGPTFGAAEEHAT